MRRGRARDRSSGRFGGRTGCPIGQVRAAVTQTRVLARRRDQNLDCADAPVAQWTEQRASNSRVAGSNPAGGATSKWASAADQSPGHSSAEVGALHLELLGVVEDFVGVAPAPGLAGLDRAGDRMP